MTKVDYSNLPNFLRGDILTRYAQLDAALGGGFPRGLVEFRGARGTGLQYLALGAVASVQRRGGKAHYIDMVHSVKPRMFEASGADMSRTPVELVANFHHAVDRTLHAIKGESDLVIMDVGDDLPSSLDLYRDPLVRKLGSLIRSIAVHADRSATCVLVLASLNLPHTSNLRAASVASLAVRTRRSDGAARVMVLRNSAHKEVQYTEFVMPRNSDGSYALSY